MGSLHKFSRRLYEPTTINHHFWKEGSLYMNKASGKRFKCKGVNKEKAMVTLLDTTTGTSFATKVFNLKRFVRIG